MTRDVHFDDILMRFTALGALMWSAMHSPRSGLCSGSTQPILSNPGPVHVELVKHVLQSVSGTLDLGLRFDGDADTLDDVVGYINSDFAGSKSDRKSTEGDVSMLAGAATVTHQSFNRS